MKPRRPRRLGVWLGGRRIADFEQGRQQAISCRYTEAALDIWPQNSPVLSCSLPLRAGPQNALAFCRGLVPEGHALHTFAVRAGVSVADTFGLLASYGRDVAGALVISEQEPDDRRFGVEPYTEATLAAAVGELNERPLGVHDDSELSLAGCEAKLPLVELGEGRWGRPQYGRPSTHILKIEDGLHVGLVAGESACLELARTAGLTTITSDLTMTGGTPGIRVSRFDRRVGSNGVGRIHQEDVCQALGLDPGEPHGGVKYERNGGPTLRQTAHLLNAYSSDPEAQLDRLVAVVTFTVLIGNADAHGKNLSIMHPTPETVVLAPLYDTVPTTLWPDLPADASMSIGGQTSLPKITVADIVREAQAWPHSAERTRKIVDTTIDVLMAAIDRGVIPQESAVAAAVTSRSAHLDNR